MLKLVIQYKSATQGTMTKLLKLVTNNFTESKKTVAGKKKNYGFNTSG